MQDLLRTHPHFLGRHLLQYQDVRDAMRGLRSSSTTLDYGDRLIEAVGDAACERQQADGIEDYILRGIESRSAKFWVSRMEANLWLACVRASIMEPGRAGGGLVMARDERLRRVRARVGMYIADLLVGSSSLRE
jgi:hypothetical protein